jgi:hypothetical protein
MDHLTKSLQATTRMTSLREAVDVLQQAQRKWKCNWKTMTKKWMMRRSNTE